jgi:hypothetical protein
LGYPTETDLTLRSGMLLGRKGKESVDTSMASDCRAVQYSSQFLRRSSEEGRQWKLPHPLDISREWRWLQGIQQNISLAFNLWNLLMFLESCMSIDEWIRVIERCNVFNNHIVAGHDLNFLKVGASAVEVVLA